MDISEMKNIRGINVEESIINAVDSANAYLRDLTKEQTCRIYSSYISDCLHLHHIPSRMINTLDLALNYEHVFLLVPDSTDYFLVDMTFNQFGYLTEPFLPLLKQGYMKIDNNLFKEYLYIVSREPVLDMDTERAFYGR